MADQVNGARPNGDGPSDPIEDAMYGVLWKVPPGPVQDALLTLFGFGRGLRDRVQRLEDAVAELQEKGAPHVDR